ncbi:Phytochrome-like protein cph1 [Streptomyces sp. ADI95-16]|uniref:sensor histidine kinase n=1 Tax=Streptomyces sp. ADI95-16 TaxID=1522758 RepID=UPI000F3AA5AD|nr:CHASE3 domain-containing protein [Streptomyces sp. ADI95-16]AYV31960.1 Phytochrome-like protein cph1 [Streptomyces sp. ADI95-16]
MSGNTKARTRRFSTWTTRRWLRAGVAVSLTVLTLLGVMGAWVLGRTESISDTLVNTKSPALSTSFRLESALLNQETGIRGYGLTGTPDFLAPYQQGLTDQATHTETLTRLLQGDAARLRDLTAVQDAVETWHERIAGPIASSPAGTASPLTAERAAEGKETFDAIRAALSSQQDRLRADRARAVQDLSDTMVLRNWVFTAIALVIAALTVLVFEGLRRGITRPLEQLGADARIIANGTFEHPITSTGPADLRRLSSEIDFMRRRLVRELAFTEEARQRLDAQAADLQRSNAELEQFAYVASHDLQEPLRKVSSFTQLLQRRYGGQLDQRADQYIDYAVDGANRMQTLINDLLDFSRVGRVHHELQSIELETVLNRTLSSLSVSIEESGAEITHDPLPPLVADPTQMGMLWQNLIGNAIKFHRPGQTPKVHISAEREGDLWRFAVTDNGIGIAPEYAEKVFVIFQRLHTKDAYSGSGIGLAMCKKIVEFHGGTIAIDPDHRDGARITFTLADEPPRATDIFTMPEAVRDGAEPSA